MIDNFDTNSINQFIEDYQNINKKIFTNLKSAMNKKDYFKFIEDL